MDTNLIKETKKFRRSLKKAYWNTRQTVLSFATMANLWKGNAKHGCDENPVQRKSTFATFKTTALPVSFLDSQTKFETTIRKTFGPGLLNVAGDIKAADLSEYLRYLKHDYVVHCMERSCQNALFTGFYDLDYWVLSETQQIKNGRLLRENEREYVIIDNNVKAMSVAINKNLIGSFSNFLERAGADGYGIHPDTALKKNNVGKSNCLEFLASRIGALDDYCHPMFLSGGDLMQNGTTS
eukprot:gene1517-1675_t